MNIYLAARYSRRREMLAYAKELEARGHVVVSRWLTYFGDRYDDHGSRDAEALGSVATEAAEKDIADVRRADLFVTFSEHDGSKGRGGRHVELGIALERGTPVALIGSREHVFHAARTVRQHESWAAFLGWLDGG